VTARLSSAILGSLSSDVGRPAYDRAAVVPGIVHLGIGAFHRAHQAAYFDQLLASGDLRWGIIGVSLRSRAVADQLNPQDGLYTLVTRSGDGEDMQVIGAVGRVLLCGPDTSAIRAAIASAAVQIITLTVTEKGYCHHPATGALRTDHPAIAHDLAHPAEPRSAIGLLVAGLAARRAAGGGAITVISCDNLPDNGQVLRALVTDFAARIDPGLQAWIASWVSFPATMIDRIVPATTADDRAALSARTGWHDEAMVKAEPFSQWVIEDNFAGARPPLERVGVQLVADVRPFEIAKLRMLNGCHSLMAYTGLLCGHHTVDQAIADPVIRALVDRLMREAAATLPVVPGLEPARYAAELIERFANPALEHRLAQIAMDGSQKLPQRLLGTMADHLRKGSHAEAAATGVAAWLLHLDGPWLNDPLANDLRALAAAAGGDRAALVQRGCAFAPVFGELGQSPDLAAQLTAAIRALAPLAATP
jgi:fructuronate reductase